MKETILIQLNDDVSVYVTGIYSDNGKHPVHGDLTDQFFDIKDIELATGTSMYDYTSYVEDYTFFETKDYMNPKNFDPITGKKFSVVFFTSFIEHLEKLCLNKINGHEDN